MVLYKNYKINRSIYKLCVSQDECKDMINKMIEYAQTSADITENRSYPLTHFVAIAEACMEIHKIFKRSIDANIAFNKGWAKTGLTFSKLYEKSLNKAILMFDEIESEKYEFDGGIDYNTLVDEVSELEEDNEWNDWLNASIGVLRNYIHSRNQVLMNVAVANILQIPIEVK